MKVGVHMTERAFEIARSGKVSTVEDIRRALRREGYDGGLLVGTLLSKQLLAIIRGKREADASSLPTLTRAQLREARELLQWSRVRLARELGISETPITRFETFGRSSSVFDPRKARIILEASGIEFTEGKGDGPGIRLRKPNGLKQGN